MPKPGERSFNGWGPFTFGMTFEDALTAHSAVEWDPKSSARCREEMRRKGCTLIPAAGSRVPLTAGVALLPTVIFNREGKLAGVRLGKFLRGETELAECEGDYGRLADHLYDRWGAPTASSSEQGAAPPRSTPKGRRYSLRTTGGGAAAGSETFAVQPDGRKILLLLNHVGATNPATAVCHLSIYYRGPESLQPPAEERPHPLKNWY